MTKRGSKQKRVGKSRAGGKTRRKSAAAKASEIVARLDAVESPSDSRPIAVQSDGDLTPKERRFVEEYLIDLNATQAAIRAGYSEKTARQIGYENLTKLHIQEAVDAAVTQRSERTQVSTDYVVGCLKEIVERCLERAPVMVRRGREMVQLVDEDDRNVWQFNSMGANSALGLLGRHLKMFTERHEHEAGPTLEAILARVHSPAPKEG